MKQIRMRVVLLALIVVAVCGYAAVHWFKSHLDSVYIADRCEQRMEQTIDPAALQSWAANLLQQYPPGRTNYAGPFILPAGLSNVWAQGQPSVYLREANNGEEQYVYIFLGKWRFRPLGIVHWFTDVRSGKS